MDSFRYLLKIIIKLVEVILIFRTKLVRFHRSDPTEILVEHYTVSQREAAAKLRAPPVSKELAPHNSELLIVIPFRDSWPVTLKCLMMLLQQKPPNNLNIKVGLVDNGSKSPATDEGIARFLSDQKQRSSCFDFKLIRLNGPFNYSHLNNEAVRRFATARTDWLLFLNNDVEITDNAAIAKLLQFANTRPDLGALGGTLVYSDSRIQHLFAAPGVKIVAAHPCKGHKLNLDWMWFKAPRPVGAVTGALMLVRKSAFFEVGMFDNSLATLGQDVDLCLKFQKHNLVNWVLPTVVAIHHEGFTKKEYPINSHEVQYIYKKWGSYLTKNNFYSSKFTRWSEKPVYTSIEGEYPLCPRFS